jgi:hypothetical protein
MEEYSVKRSTSIPYILPAKLKAISREWSMYKHSNKRIGMGSSLIAGLHAPSMAGARPFAAPSGVRRHQRPRRVHAGDQPEPEPAPPWPVHDRGWRGRATSLRGGARRRPVRWRRPQRAARQDQLLQLVRLLHFAWGLRGARLRGVGAEQRGMGPRLLARRAHGAHRSDRRPCGLAVLPAPGAHG